MQEVMRQIARRMAAQGHDVTVATTWHPQRSLAVSGGVKIREFKAGGSLAYGLSGQIDEYRKFVGSFDADAILIMAAQQWSFDALWPVLDDIKARKVFIPCGFSGLFEPDFAQYFRELPDVLKKFDHLIFNAEKYRDIDFVRRIGSSNFTVLPNGINELEFEQEADGQFRRKLGIPDNAFLFLTVGNPIEAKGHRDVVDAFSRLDTDGRVGVLLAVAGWPGSRFGSARIGRLGAAASRVAEIVRLEGPRGLARVLRRKVSTSGVRPMVPFESIESMAAKASAKPFKRVILTDLNRPDLIQAYFAADLFVFASRVEYSPLVLFEASAAGTPFLTVPVGNADEIVRWTGGGIICDADRDDRGYTRVDPETLAKEMAHCMKNQEALRRMGSTARARSRRDFTWKVVARYYEDILAGRTPDVHLVEQEVPMDNQRSRA